VRVVLLMTAGHLAAGGHLVASAARIRNLQGIAELDAKYYPNYVRPDVRFDRAIRRYLHATDSILDAGAGRGEKFRYDYKTWVERVVGVDVEEGVLTNPNLDEAYVADLADLPFDDATFDLVFSRCVLEHVEDPVSVLEELRRVLRPNGHLIFRVPSRFHYVSIAARLTPLRFHRWFNAQRGFGAENFPTFYRINDRSTLRSLAAATGYGIRELELFEMKPSYLVFHPLAYRVGIGYERLVNRFDRLQGLRSNIIGVFEAV
jgi:SAM-dependent methyltransferase